MGHLPVVYFIEENNLSKPFSCTLKQFFFSTLYFKVFKYKEKLKEKYNNHLFSLS